MVHSIGWYRGIRCLTVVIGLLGIMLTAWGEDEIGRDFKVLHQFDHPSFNKKFFNLAREALSRAANVASVNSAEDGSRREIRVNTTKVLQSLQGLVCQELAAAVYQRVETELKLPRPDVPLLQQLLVTYISVAGAYNLPALHALGERLGEIEVQQRPLFSDQQIEKLLDEGRKIMQTNAPEAAPVFINKLLDLPRLYQEDPALTFYDIVDELRQLLLPIDEDGTYQRQTYQEDVLAEEDDEYAFLEETPSPFNSLGEHLVGDNLMAVDLGDYRYQRDPPNVTLLPDQTQGSQQDKVTLAELNPPRSTAAPVKASFDQTIMEILADARTRDAQAELLTEASEQERLQKLADLRAQEDATVMVEETSETREIPVPESLANQRKARKQQDYRRRQYLRPFEWENDLRKRIKEELIGQDEVVEKFLAMEFRVSLYGTKEKPDVLVLMGAPGTGKDTAVRSFVNAMHASHDAWRDHVYEIKPMLSKADVWTHLGSATGYTGSETLPPLIKFLVSHSAGRYELEALPSTDKSGQKYRVAENPSWRKGGRNSDALPPSSAIIYLNEFHNWSKEMKDYFLKMPFETGIFKIPDPKGGVEALQVPVRFIIATNEGTELVAARESNGNRFGEPLSYEAQIEKWNHWKDNAAALKAALSKTNGNANGSTRPEDAKGISEELLNRIPEGNFVLMRPLAPEALQEVARQKLTAIRNQFAKGMVPEYRKMHLTWTEGVLKFIQSYHYVAEENARPIEDRAENLIEQTLFTILKRDDLVPLKDDWELNLDVEILPDKTWNLVARMRPWIAEQEGTVTPEIPFQQEVRELIVPTLADKAVAPISDERLAELFSIKQKLGKQVFGIDDVLDRLARAIVISEEGRARGVHEKKAKMPARSFMFLGLSSTGKTETAKALAEALYGDRLNAVTIDFSQVQTIMDLKIKILGGHDGLGNPVPSEFMKHFDRLQGKVLFIFDEIANTPRDVLKALYDILREPVVTTFSDGKPRAMQSVCIIMTGNIGEEYFFRMPADLSLHMQRLAMDEIYHSIVSRPELLRHILLQHFSPAMLNRIGERNIFFFPPLSLQAQRELTLHKLTKALASLMPQEDRRGWPVRFSDPENFYALIDALEDASLIPREQGASVDRFLSQDFASDLRYFLLREPVPSGVGITLSFAGLKRIEEDQANPTFYQQIQIQVKVDGRSTPLLFTINGPQRPILPKQRPEDLIKTALHEAGHEIVDQTFFKDVHQSRYISIIPGVSTDFDDLVVYLGISSHQNTHRIPITRGKVLRTLAVLLGGTMAQELTSDQAGEDAGKSNDIQVASRLAYNAVLRWGLAPRWGNAAIGDSVDLAAHIASLSEQKRRALEHEVRVLLEEGKALAAQALVANYATFIKLSMRLLARGKLDTKDLAEFYQRYHLFSEASLGKLKWNPAWWKAKLSLALKKLWPSQARDLRLKEGVFDHRPMIVNLEELFKARKAAEVAKVKLPAEIIFMEESKELPPPRAAGETGNTAAACAHLFLP